MASASHGDEDAKASEAAARGRKRSRPRVVGDEDLPAKSKYKLGDNQRFSASAVSQIDADKFFRIGHSAGGEFAATACSALASTATGGSGSSSHESGVGMLPTDDQVTVDESTLQYEVPTHHPPDVSAVTLEVPAKARSAFFYRCSRSCDICR